MKQRYQITVKGAVQGVGFRPFIYKLANELQLKGFISNNISGVNIEVEGAENILDNFLLKIRTEKPKLVIINLLEYSVLDLVGYEEFKIDQSDSRGDPSAIILPDIAVCDDCLSEMFDKQNRRSLYPFINCTNCGPRFSIIESLPYDRPNTSMKNFEMCDDCRDDYQNPDNRRFHAQPIACPKCGPYLESWTNKKELVGKTSIAFHTTIEKLKEGKIVALKGLGGFQLIVDSTNESAVKRLREKKHRDEKPFALMCSNLESIKKICVVSDPEEKLLLSGESPIVLLRRKINPEISVSNLVAPNNPCLGIMLPYTPLHHLLMKEICEPVIATSGNISEEPMCIENNEAFDRLSGIADFFLVHNRPIVRAVDDSVARVVNNKHMILRRARGYAPLPFYAKNCTAKNLISVGSHLKNSISMKKGKNIFISQHIGDLSNTEAEINFRSTISDFKKLYNVNPDFLVHDLHPEYFSTKYCAEQNTKTIEVQHHLAHVAGCYEDNQIEGKCFSVCWDGTGYGFDGTVWGGEFFIYSNSDYEHAAQFRQFKLPGGEMAVKEPERSLIGILYAIFSKNIPYDKLGIQLSRSSANLLILEKMLERNINCFTTSSAGRIFDAVSSLLNICQKSSYEGQAAMMLEFAADMNVTTHYRFSVTENSIMIVDWQPLFEDIISDISAGISVSEISAKFHNTLVEIILLLAKLFNEKKIILTGGCFQNIFLLERSIEKLSENGFSPYWNHHIPANDGGISFGQAIFASNLLMRQDKNLQKIIR